jgi:Amt family ammonium transporter
MNKEFTLHYQPIISLKNENIVCFEALIRWRHPVKGIIPPDRFIPLAEETGLIVEIGKWVVAEACRDLKHWQSQVPEAKKMTVSVNISTRQFIRPGLVEHIIEVLNANNLAPSCLKVEVTESVIMQDVEHTVAELKRLGDLGVEVALDDFGTGYSSLSYLHKMPINYLKIDRSFINELEKVEGNLQIVKSIISLAKVLGVKVVAEGVEHPEQKHKLSLLGCNYGQGYLFSRPVENNKALSLIKKLSG